MTEQHPHPNPSRLKRSLIPSLASVAIHAALALALLGITIERFTAPTPRPARLALEPTAPPPKTQPDTPPPEAQTPTPRPLSDTARSETTREAIARATDQLTTRATRPAPQPTATPRPAPIITRTPPPPAVAFAGSQASAATKIVFAVDASGAMVTSFSFVQDELARAINTLQPTQSFQIILFGLRTDPDTRRADPYRLIPHSGNPTELIRATHANRVLARRWINAALPGGKSNPVEGLTRALEFDPDLVFLLARGIQRTGAIPDPNDQRAVLTQLDIRNPIDQRTGLRPTVIKAIEFVEPDPTGLIERIARTHGDGEGSLRLITPENKADPEPIAETPDPSESQGLATATNALAALAIDAADTAVLARIATDSETARARDAAERANASLTDLPPPTRRTTDPRPHLLRARAALLAATLETHPPRRTDLATQAIDDLTPLRITDPAAAAERDTMLARAYLTLDLPEPAYAGLLALLRTADPTDPNLAKAPSNNRAAALEAALVRAQIARLDAATALDPLGPEAARARDAAERAVVERPITDPTLHALLSAALTRANLAAGRPIADALAPLTDLYTDITLPRDTCRTLAAPRLDAIVRAGAIPLDTLPTAALRILADVATWPPPEGRLSPADHARAQGLLTRLADRSSSAPEHALSLRDAAHHARLAGNLTDARDLSFRLAAEHPTHPDAEAALTLAVGTEPSTDTLERALAINPAHPLADTWRLDLARATRGQNALDLLAAVTRPTRDAAALALDLIDGALPTATDTERTALLARAADEARVLADDLDPNRRLLLARSLATTDPDQAERTLADLPPNLTRSPDADRVRLAIAETRAADPKTSPAAFESARAIADRRSADDPNDPDLYWHAVTLWLELGATNGGAEARAAARAHIAGLRQTHPTLGGDPWRTRLNAIAD